MAFDLVSALGNLREPDIQNEIDFGNMDAAELKGTINGLVDQVTASSDCITESEVFDTFQSLLNCTSSLPGTAVSSILDVLLSAFEAELVSTTRDANPTDHAAYRSHKPALEAYAFLLLWFVQAAEKLGSAAVGGADGATVTTLTAGKRGQKGKAKGKGKTAAAGANQTFDWTAEIPAVLEVMAKALRLKTEFIWQTTPERDAFVSCFTKAAYQLAESEAYMKSADIRNPIFKVICVAAKSHGQALSTQTSIMQSLQYSEHLSDPMAELVHILNMTFDMPQIGDALLRDLASKHFSAQDTKGPRSFSRFLVKLAELSPRLVLKQIVVLKKHLDSEAYPMRNALLEVIAKLIKELSSEGSREEAAGRDAANGGDRGEAGEKDEEMQKRQVEGFWELLLERFADSNTYVRSKVVAVCEEILGFPAKFPSQRLLLARHACRSLEDKSSQVRKHCITVFVKLIESHPYGLMHGGELDRDAWTDRYEGVVKELDALALPSMEELGQQEDAECEEGDQEEEDEESQEVDDEDAANEEGEAEGQASDEDEDQASLDGTPRPKRVKKYQGAKKRKAPRKSDMDLAAIGQQEALAHLDQNKLAWLKLQKKYYADALTFIETIERAMPHIQKLLASKTKSEVLESINFFKTAVKYKIEGADAGVKRMLHLIWSKDNSTVEDGKEVKGVRHALIDCYRDLYFAPTLPEEGETPAAYAKRNIDRITRNMIELTYGATLAELTSLEQLMAIMMEQDNVPDDVVTKLWQVYSTSKDIPRDQRRGAIMILGMLAAPKPEVVTDHLDKVISIGLGAIGKADLVLAKYSCIALRRIGGSAKKVKGSLNDKNIRLPMDNPIFQRLSDAIQNPTSSKDWFAMAEQAINTIYGLGDQPDALCSQIIRQMTVRVFGTSAGASESASGDAETTEDEEPVARSRASSVAPSGIDGDVPASQSSESGSKPGSKIASATADAFQLSQVIFIAGHCAVKQLVHLELVEREFKRRKADSEKKGPAGDAAGEELDQVAGNVEDDIGDIIAHTKEKELLHGPDSLLAIFGPMAVQICGLPKVYKNQTLRTAATLSLSKFMCVSAEFCEQHLMLLFKVLETSKDPAIRSNIVIALGDIAVCFATIMDQNSDRLYAGLTDHDLTVKKNTLMVLTHLILNGMIKVKGQLGEMAKCLEDEEERISDLARLFFTELSTKDNAIYNNLPDIISHLSVGKHAVKEESFRSTMAFIFTFLEKEKQAESIIEKLCQRFRLVTEPRQWQDIAYCLSLLPYKSERTVKKLVDGLPFYQDKLYEPEVFKCFQDILVKARGNKATKNESDLAEFEAALEQHKAKGEDDAAMEAKVQKKKAKAATKKPARRQRRASTPLSSDGE